MRKNDSQEFNLSQVNLSGIHLVEANAGTGKTYSICAITLRLLATGKAQSSDIFVASFTRKNAEELKEAVYEKLKEAYDTLSVPYDATLEDPILQVIETVAQAEGRDTVKARLGVALSEFDCMRISTIDSFLSRMTSEYGTYLSLAGALKPTFGEYSETDLETARSFWKTTVLADPWCSLIMREWLKIDSPEKLVSECMRWVQKGKPDTLQYLARDEQGQVLALPDLVNRVCEAHKASDTKLSPWLTQLRPFRKNQWLPETLGFGKIKKGDYANACAQEMFDWADLTHSDAELHEAVLENLNDFLLNSYPSELPPAALSVLCSPSSSSESEVEGDPIVCLLELVQALTDLAYWLIHQALVQVHGLSLNSVFIQKDIKLSNLVELTLESLEKQPTIADKIRSRWKYVLVDEFQDTSEPHFDILYFIWGEQGNMFLFGDPKQLIYEFRSGGFELYLTFRDRLLATNRLSIWHLTTCFRSTEAVIEGVNQVFRNESTDSESGYKFANSTIDYFPSNVAAVKSSNFTSPFAYLNGAGVSYSLFDKKDKSKSPVASCVQEIADILVHRPNEHLKDGKPIQPSDIAILTRTNNTAQMCKELLHQHGISCELSSAASVGLTDEAEWMYMVMSALTQPHNEALANVLVESKYVYLGDFENSDFATKQQILQEQLRNAYEKWVASNWLTAFLYLVKVWRLTDAVREYSLDTSSLIHLRHLAEIVSEETQDMLPTRATTVFGQWVNDVKAQNTMFNIPKGVKRLLKVPQEQRDVVEGTESVKIMTIHRAKGLEFPIVFVPADSIKDSEPKILSTVTHNSGNKCSVQLRNHRSELLLKQEEVLSQRRLFYVALTRAEFHVRLFLTNAEQDIVRVLPDCQYEQPLSHSQAFRRQKQQANFSTFSPSLTPEVPLSKSFRFDSFSGFQFRDEGNYSLGSQPRFGYTRSATEAPEESQPERGGIQDEAEGAAATAGDPTNQTEQPPNEAQVSFDFAGFPLAQSLPISASEFGNLVHRILEEIDFSLPQTNPEKWAEIVRQQTESSLLTESVNQALIHSLAIALNSPIGELAAGGKSYSLQAVKEYIAEGYFGMNWSSESRVKFMQSMHSIGIVGDLIPSTEFKGILHGFVDLTYRDDDGMWWIADFKSNYLGGGPDDYREDALQETVRKHNYEWQGCVYTLMLYRWLKLKIPDFTPSRHIGGYKFLFLRGMNSQVESETPGVYTRRLSADQLEILNRAMEANSG